MTPREQTRRLLLEHCKKYPLLEVQDILKYLHQSAFGCEHLLSSLDTVIGRIADESSQVQKTPEGLADKLDGGYSRVHLGWLSRGLSAQTLGKLFVMSAKPEPDGRDALRHKLDTALELAVEGKLPVSPAELEKAAAQWEKGGFEALHHSDKFRKCYNPAYRVVSDRFVPFLPLLAEVDKLLEGDAPVLVAIEGGAASGKSTLGRLLEQLYDCTLVHMDDFFLQPYQRTPERYAEAGGNVDRERFEAEVLLPLSQNKPIEYRRFDCGAMTLLPAETITPKKLTVIEGAYSMHPQLAPYYSLSAFLDIDPEMLKKRIENRNPPYLAKRFFEEWIPLEGTYFRTLQVKERCDIVIKIDE